MKITYDLKEMISEKSGYEYIASKKLYIPIEEIGLNVLIRKQQQLLFFYEIILKLISNGITYINQISEITGVEEEILNDVVADMSVEQLVYPIGGNLKLTIIGKQALSKLMQEVIEKDFFNKIFVDCITGKIYDSINIVDRRKHNNPWLEKEINIDNEFIMKKFNEFNRVYMERQEEYNTDTLGIVKYKEIYQIIKKEYGTISYLEKNIKVFRNESDNSFIFETGSDEDNDYILSFRKQLENRFGANEIFVNQRNFPKNINTNFVECREKIVNLNNLTESIKNSNEEDIEKYYEKDRYLYIGELEKILLNIKKISPSKIVISSKCLREILNNDVIQILNSILDRTEVTILADKAEWKIEDLKLNMLNKKNNKKNNIQWKYSNNELNKDIVILYPYCIIERFKVPIKYDEQKYILKDVATISCEIKNIDLMLNSILKN